MQGFVIITPTGNSIRFAYYVQDAPQSVQAFNTLLPFSQTFYHARVSGQEVWVANAFHFAVPQENASVFTQPGEVVLGSSTTARAKGVAGAIGIYYGEGRGLDAANIFAKVFDEDLPLLQTLGERIWKQGQQALRFEAIL